MKQDRHGVRTASDLERKYNFTELKKATEQVEQTIVRVNQILQDYVNTVLGNLASYEGLVDGFVTTYFYSGVPTLNTLPVTEWTDSYDNHVNDLYYDRDTGKAYDFLNSDGEYGWVEVVDKGIIDALAMANSTIDAVDNKRRIFIEQPIPPYDNGDLWLKNGDIYTCQISKPQAESFADDDFIVSAQYTVDTLAIQIGSELEVLRGTVLKVIEDADYLRVELTDLDEEYTSEIELLKNQLSTLITDEYGQSMMIQTPEGIKFEMKTFLDRLNEQTSYVHVDTVDGQPYVELGVEGSGFKLVFTPTGIIFKEGSTTPASISDGTMNAENVTVKDTLKIGTIGFVVRGNNHISLMPLGEVM